MKRFVSRRLRAACSLLTSLSMLAGPAAWAQDDAAQDERQYDVKFSGTPLDMVMQDYSELTGRTVLTAPGVTANITLKSQSKLSTREYLNAIESILAMHNIAIVPYGEKFVKVVPAAEARLYSMPTQITPPEQTPPDTDMMVSRVITLNHMELVEAMKVVDALKSKNARVHTLERINGLLITDLSANINRVTEMLSHIDQPIEVREKFFVLPVRNIKPSEVKAKLEEIIADLKEKTPTPTVARPAASGPPGMVSPPTPAGVIRYRPPTPAGGAQPAVADVAGEVERGIVRGKVKIVADDRTGILIFVTLESNMPFFENVVKALDVATGPDVVVQVYRLEFADAEAIAGMLNTLIGARKKETVGGPSPGAPGAPGAGQGSVTLPEYVEQKGVETEGRKSKIGELSAENIKILPDKRTNALIVMASKSDITAMGEIIKEMDMPLSQVLIEAVVLDIDLTDEIRTGVDWLQRSLLVYDKTAAGGRTPVMAFSGKGGGGKMLPQDATLTPGFPTGDDTHGIYYYFTHYGLNLDMVVQMASKDTRTKILQSPVILTTDNTEARITSTEQIYVYAGIKYDQSGNYQKDWSTKDVGLELKVKPHINTNNVVMLEISQTMSEPGQATDPASGVKVSSTRTLNAFVSVKSGETIVLGGQVRSRKEANRDKIPVLGDVPLVGRLFNHAYDYTKRTEMVVFLTPYVLDTSSAMQAEAVRRKRAVDMERMWLRGPDEWSASLVADPSREQEKIEKRAAKETGKKADPYAGLDPAVRKLIERKESRWGRSLEKVDKHLE